MAPPCTPQQAPNTTVGGLASPLVKQLLASTKDGSVVLDTFQQILSQLHQQSQPGMLHTKSALIYIDKS